jgi:DamX protein
VIAPPKDAEPAPPSVATPIALPTVPAPLPAKAERTRAYSIEWLRTQAAAGYVLQLFGVRDRVAAVNLIRDRKISDHSAVLVTYHENAPWYVVVYGYYTDRVAAQAAIVDLPGNLAATRPWARPIASLN